MRQRCAAIESPRSATRHRASLIGPHTEVLDRPGRLLVPGFQNSHVHPPHAGYERSTVDLHDLSDRPAYLAAIAAYADSHPPMPNDSSAAYGR
jgi:predicted amidohydrolase YtcJ